MTEIYKNKQAADTAAKEYAWENMHKGYECIRHEAGDRVEVASWHTLGIDRVYYNVKTFFFKPQAEIKKDTPVWVRDRDFDDWEDQEWEPAYATGRFNEEGKILCYSSGTTSFTTSHEDAVWAWYEYSLTDPEKKD